MEFRVSAQQMRSIAAASRTRKLTTALPELKTQKLAWSLMYAKYMQAPGKYQRIDTLAQPRQPSYAYPEALQYDSTQAFAKAHSPTQRSISPRYNMPDHQMREAANVYGPGAYSPVFTQVEKGPVLSKLLMSRTVSQFDRLVRTANKVGPGYYNPYIGEEFERSKRGFSMRGRDCYLAQAECYCDYLSGEEVLTGWKICEKGDADIRINKTERFKGENTNY